MGQANRKFGQYTTLDELGHGRFADVYRAKNDGGKEVAIKVIRKNYTVSVFIKGCLNTFQQWHAE